MICPLKCLRFFKSNLFIAIMEKNCCYCSSPASSLTNYKIVMVRHGESEFNRQNLFCGWYDAQLSEKGVQEATEAGKTLKENNYKFDTAFTSVLSRAHETLRIILEELGQPDLPVQKTWRLNERHYGNLTGLNKSETAAKYGEEQVAIWRRSYDVPPPKMEEGHPYYGQIVYDPRYKPDLPLECFPMFESLKLTIERTLPYWNEMIVPQILKRKSILIVAHGNSLRGIVKHLDSISDEGIMKLNLPTGIPFYYILDRNLRPVADGSLKFLGDEETVRKAMEAVALQGQVKNYNDGPCEHDFPSTESLKDVQARVSPLWELKMVPILKSKQNVLVVAHGTSLRAIVKIVGRISDEAIRKINIPNGIPFFYVLNHNMSSEGDMQFMADAVTVKKKQQEIAEQGKKKKNE